MNPNYFNRNLVDSMAKSLEKVIVNESEMVKKRSAIRDQAIAANEAKRATQAQIKALAQQKANEAAKAAGQEPGRYGAEHYKAAMAELKADPKFVEQLDTANRFKGWGGGNFGGSSQRTEGSSPISGMAERGAAAMADQAEREREIRLKNIKQGYDRDGIPMPGTPEWDRANESPQERISRIQAELSAERSKIEAEERTRLDVQQIDRDDDLADAKVYGRETGKMEYTTPEQRATGRAAMDAEYARAAEDKRKENDDDAQASNPFAGNDYNVKVPEPPRIDWAAHFKEIDDQRKNTARIRLERERAAAESDPKFVGPPSAAAGRITLDTDPDFVGPPSAASSPRYEKSVRREPATSRPQDRPTGTIKDLFGNNGLFGLRSK